MICPFFDKLQGFIMQISENLISWKYDVVKMLRFNTVILNKGSYFCKVSARLNMNACLLHALIANHVIEFWLKIICLKQLLFPSTFCWTWFLTSDYKSSIHTLKKRNSFYCCWMTSQSSVWSRLWAHGMISQSWGLHCLRFQSTTVIYRAPILPCPLLKSDIKCKCLNQTKQSWGYT